MKNLTKYLASLCLIVAMLASGKAGAQQSLTTITGWNAYVHLPANYATSGISYPTIVFFPGLGEVGTVASKVIASGPGAYITQGWNGNVSVNGNTVEFIVISIQPSAAYPNEIRLNQAIQAIKSTYRVDNNRLYLTGLSHGGWCSSTFVSGDPYGGPYTYASQIAAVVTVQGMRPDDNSPYPNLFDNYANAGGRYLGFEQTLDNRDTKTVVDRMNATVANSAIYVQTNFGGGGHCCWNEYYGGGGKQPGNFMLDGISQNIYQWMARQSLNGTTPPPPPPANTPPVANAGSDKTITLPVNSTTLNGTGTDANGTISSYKWTLFYGPSAATISNSTSANATIGGLVQGTYQVDLTVTDNNGATATDRMQVIVNAAAVVPNQLPAANAGTDKTITLPTNNVTLSGSGTDPDGTITSYAWTKISGPTSGSITNATSASASLTGLMQGVYQYQLKVTDDKGATATDNVQVTVNAAPVPPSGNQIPVINAGVDVVVSGGTYASLNGNGSDPDGYMTGWQWRKISGPSSEPISNASAANAGAGGLVTGVYTFELEGTDNAGGKGRDTMLVLVGGVTIPPVTNQPPVANAGIDKIITLPVSSTSLSGTGTDSDGSISSYLWTKISGPATTISSATSAITNITGMTQGIYIFELRVTDNGSTSASDRVQVTVNAAVPPPPPPATGLSVNVNIHSGTATYSNVQWNNWNLSSLSSTAFKYEDGSLSTIKATFTSNDRIVDNGTNYATTSTTVPSPVLRYNSAQTSNRDLIFSGLNPAKTYSFKFYGSRKGTGNKTVYTIGNKTDTVNTDNNINDVAHFTNITPDNSGKVYVTLSRIGTWHYIAGFTVSESDENRMITSASPSQSIMGTQPSASPAVNGTTGKELTGVRAYPNPFMNAIQVDLSADITGKYTINVIDVSGKILITKNGEKGNMSITETVNASNLTYGIYFIEIRSDQGRVVHTLKKILPVQM